MLVQVHSVLLWLHLMTLRFHPMLRSYFSETRFDSKTDLTDKVGLSLRCRWQGNCTKVCFNQTKSAKCEHLQFRMIKRCSYIGEI